MSNCLLHWQTWCHIDDLLCLIVSYTDKLDATLMTCYVSSCPTLTNMMPHWWPVVSHRLIHWHTWCYFDDLLFLCIYYTEGNVTTLSWPVIFPVCNTDKVVATLMTCCVTYLLYTMVCCHDLLCSLSTIPKGLPPFCHNLLCSLSTIQKGLPPHCHDLLCSLSTAQKGMLAHWRPAVCLLSTAETGM